MIDYSDRGFLFPYIRFLNASPQGGSLDFYIGNTLVAAGIKFGTFTSYMKTSTAPVTYKATRAGKKDDVVQTVVICQNIGEVRSLCVVNKADKPEFMAIEEPTLRNNMEYGHLRICNFSPDKRGFDVYANETRILGDVNFKEISRYMEIRPQSYEISLWHKEKRILNCGKLNMKHGKFNTLYITGLENENPYLSHILSTDAASYSGFYL